MLKQKIGFAPDTEPVRQAPGEAARETIVPRISLADVWFPDDNRTLTYFNDCFTLKPGDIVFVDGKLEGKPGRVRELHYNFRIRPDQYRKIIARADTRVHGELFHAGSHFLTFDPAVLPREQVTGWFFPPREEEYIVSGDDEEFCLDEPSRLPFSPQIAGRGRDYFLEERVRYLTVRDGEGFAVVEGGAYYQVEFRLEGRMISNLTCTCPCSGPCKHGFAVILQLLALLEKIDASYPAEFGEQRYFAAISGSTLDSYVLSGRESGSILI